MPVKIVHTITKLELGGAQQNTLYTLEHLPDDYEGRLLCGEGGILDEEAEKSEKYTTIFCPFLRRKINPYFDWRAYKWMVKYFNEIKPDIIHSHSSKAGILSRWAAKKAGVPVIIHTFHGFGFNPLQSKPIRKFFIWLEKKAAKVTTKLIFVSHANKNKAKSLGIGEDEQYMVVRSGIDIEKFAYQPEPRHRYLKNFIDINLQAEDKIIGNISCFKPQKGLHDFIRACSRLKDMGSYKFVLIGDGVLRQELEKQVKEAGLSDYLAMPGWWEEDVAKIIPEFDIMLHTAYFEGLPRVFLEAMACGVTIVATDVDGASDVIEHGVNGYLAKTQDIESMSGYVHELLQDESKRRIMGKKGREKLSVEFNISTMSDILNELYNKLIKG